MIGETIEAPRSFSWGAVFFFFLGAVACALGFSSGQHHWYVAATLPVLLGCALWRARDLAFVAEFTTTTLEIQSPPLSIAYADMEGLKTKGRPSDPTKKGPKTYPIQVLYSGGVLRIPKHLNVASDRVFHFLYAQFTPSGSRMVNSALQEFLSLQEREFGPDRVWAYRARRHLGGGMATRRPLLIGLSLILCGIAWMVAGSLEREARTWLFIGLSVTIIGLIFAAASWYDALHIYIGPAHKKWREASLVISPIGLALVQGQVRGELRWEELRDVHLYRKPRHFQMEAALPGIHLKVEGATIIMLDVYDRPLAMIYDRILHYWRPEK